MQRIFSTLIILACLSVLTVSPAAASWFFSDNTLVSINGKAYSKNDFKSWWKYWKEDKQPLPETPEPYIDWLLLAQEGKRMELDTDPGFKYQTKVFVEARTLFLLKYEEVDKKVRVTRDQVEARYREKYVPRWKVERLNFKDEATAMTAWQQLKDGKVKVKDLVANQGKKGGPVSTYENWLRPKGIDPGWVALFKEMKVGEVLDPTKTKKGPTLYYLKDEKGGDTDDLQKLQKMIGQKLMNEQEATLTQALITKLRNQYEVKVDEKRLDALDISGAPKTFGDEPVITTNKKNVSEKQYMAVMRKVLKNRPLLTHDLKDKKKLHALKFSVADNIIAQMVTDWGTIDRHFEREEPFKSQYDFNYNYRLEMALQQRLLAPKIKVTDEEVKQAYEKHLDRYSRPATVTVFIVDETQGPIDKMWAEVAAGKRFEDVIRKQFGVKAKSVEAPENHLDSEVRPVVAKLADGETSQIFKAQGIRVMVHLVKRTPAQPIPFGKVKDSIRSRLWNQKLNVLREAMLNKLKSSSKIEVHEAVWKDLQTELGDKK